jgi:hypothetical protein
MSLKNTDISKVKRLSLKEVKLPAPELKAEATKVDRPPTAEEIAFINKDVKHWRNTIKYKWQLIRLIKVRFIEQTGGEWTEAIDEYINKVI